MSKLKILLYLLYFVSTIAMVSVIIKGQWDGNLLFQNLDSKLTSLGSPFESSGSTSRYILTEAIVEDNTFLLNEVRAKFAAPDVVKSSKGYISIFTPGASFIGVPFYRLGVIFGFPQIATYLSTALFALANAFLIIKISRKLGAGELSSLISGLLYLFATNALPYLTTLTQHHASTFFILLGTVNAFGQRNLKNNIIFGIIYGSALLMDIPNGIIMLPLVFYIAFKQIKIREIANKIKVYIKFNFLGILIGLLPLLGLFGFYNYQTTGSYTTLAQFIGRSDEFADNVSTEVKIPEDRKSINIPFQTRNQLEGFYIFLISDQRSIFVYHPIILIGIIGLVTLYKKRIIRGKTSLLLSLILMNFLIYTMFPDPTGSWAFGPRYLLPATALLMIGAGSAIDIYKKSRWFVILFFILTTYSVSINTLGATTTTQVPPKVEAVNLPNPIPYTYEYNWQLMTEKGLNSSLFYNLYANKYVSSLQYAALYAGAAILLISVICIAALFEKKKEEI